MHQESHLQKIQPTIQQIVMVISSVLKIEVEVADQNLFRIAGTGEIKQDVWKAMTGEDAVYQKCLQTGETIIIQNPGFHPLCKNCPHEGNCLEKAEICTPILLEKEVIGVIGLIAFTEEQRKRLLSELNENLSFLEKLSEIISSKVREDFIFQQKILSEKKIAALIDYIDTGLLMFNEHNQCDFLNDQAKNEFDILSKESLPQEITNKLLAHRQISKHGDFIWLTVNGVIKKFIIHVNPLSIRNNRMGKVIVLKNPKQITKLASELAANSQGIKLIGASESIIRAKKNLVTAAQNTLPLLITGEDGTGKNHAAKYLHSLAHREKDLYHRINASFYTDEELRLELFGDTEHSGLLRKLDGGTLVIDEADKLGPSSQTWLKRFLDTCVVNQGNSAYKVYVQIVCLSHNQLLDLVSEGKFRQDLYYKIAICLVHLPSLRERSEDIILLSNEVLTGLNAENAHIPEKSFTSEVYSLLTSYDWPGNIQELYNVIRYAYQVTNSTKIDSPHFPNHLTQLLDANPPGVLSNDFNLASVEKDVIKRALAHMRETHGTKEDAAKLLGIGRATLFRKISEYQL